ncbi:photoreceptor-specific nuclear receptor [Caerostris extrusa]|uniref:Photoreceptor-specific nuclear receptor n=1 Tax=Caerostris extrusa TaxID=172846 RepID=A0AAV4SPV7_CAEEX|nr:photoreceptor-specific nuclear receptor [Caerostris extrusa]
MYPCAKCIARMPTVQNERQPRSTATVRPESTFARPVSTADDVFNTRFDAKAINAPNFQTFVSLHPKTISPMFAKVNEVKLCESATGSKDRTQIVLVAQLRKGRIEKPLWVTQAALWLSSLLLISDNHWVRSVLRVVWCISTRQNGSQS